MEPPVPRDGPCEPDPAHDAELKRGTYLAHCGTCHTPRNLFMAEKTTAEMAGADITSDANSGVGGWSIEELVAYMRDGPTAKSQAAGPMAEAIDHSLRHLTAEDLKAIATYLKTVPPVRDADDTKPGFAKELSDTQVATLGTYLIGHFGNPDARVTAQQVATSRAGSPAWDWLIWTARIGLAVGALVTLLLIVLLFRWRGKGELTKQVEAT